MKTNRLLQFGLLFFVLATFSLMSLGYMKSDGELIQAVSAANDEDTDVFVSIQDPLFDNKVLAFIKTEKVCVLTAIQAGRIAAEYPVENKELTVDGEPVKVIYAKGTPLNRNKLEDFLGEDLLGKCNAVHGRKVIAIITPIFVS